MRWRLQLVPEDLRSKKIPCRYIPLDEQGQTVDYFYRFGKQEELETVVAQCMKNDRSTGTREVKWPEEL